MLKRHAAVLSAAGLVLCCANIAIAEDAPSLTERQAQTVDRLIDAGLEDDVAWEVLESVTTEVGPRLAGSEAEARARDWGAAKLKQLGFKNVRIETYEMPYWERVKEEAEIVSPFPQPLIVTALGNSIATPEGGLTGEVVRFRTLPELQAAPETGLEGKIVFVDEPMARTQNGSGYGTAVQKRSQAAVEAGKRGAVAALIRSAGTDSHRNPHTGGATRGGAPTAVPTAALSNPDADQLARAVNRAEGPVTVRLDLQVKTAESVTSGNVIGEIPGKTDELIVVGGHLDSWDLGTGAIDDGAGIAITTAAAKLVGDLRGKPTRTIRVVMWGAEEVGVYGGAAYAEAHKDEIDKHIIAAESDFGAGPVWRFDTGVAEAALPKAEVIEKALRRLAIIPGDNHAHGGADIGAIRGLGVPVAGLVQDGTDYFDLHHTPDDTLDKVDPAALRQNVAAWAAFIYLASEMDGDFGRLPVAQEE
ncbi:M20/M25/M40 family metallo-hydrolase [Hyphococcus luteus]|uniref:Carboxypeptidase Q n=1 Tax=Hyphococcus luteus TaxID=2058213 RepID=A0A2S7K682_9PROT|nr:M20/M25/M40 family metallo-hydrolase [Marinicaulis flavus]PQA88013.1 peptidase M28 family protein [Marinicaulis flavus]